MTRRPSHRTARPTALAAVLVAGTLLGACTTTYDSSIATVETVAASTTSTLPTGSTTDLLARLLEEVRVLSTRVVDNDGDTAAATRIEQLWDAVRADVTTTAPELVEDFEFVMRRCRAAVDRNRPADADRAFKNLELLVAAYPG